MNNRQTLVQINQEGRGRLKLALDNDEVGFMDISVVGKVLTVYHTEVYEQYLGQGFGSQLFDTMIEYARSKDLKVKPLCTFVAAMFKKDKEAWADLLA